MKETKDFTATVAALMKLIGGYAAADQHKTGSPEGVYGGKVMRKEYGEDVGAYTSFMDLCMSFVASYGAYLAKHQDLWTFLSKVAFEKHLKKHSRSFLQSIRISYTDVNPQYVDITLVFIPTNTEHTQFTYKTSMPKTFGQDENAIAHMLDKMHYCYTM